MTHRSLHVALNTGRCAVQKLGTVNPDTLQVLGRHAAWLLNSRPALKPTWLPLPIPFFSFRLSGGRGAFRPSLFPAAGRGEENCGQRCRGNRPRNRRGPVASHPQTRPHGATQAANELAPHAVVCHRAEPRLRARWTLARLRTANLSILASPELI